MTKTATRPKTRSASAADTGTVHRVARLLSELVDRPGASVANLAARLELPRSTTHRLLALLRDEGFADNGGDGGFTVGAELLRIASRLSSDFPFQRIADPILRDLSDRFHETALLTLLARRQLRMFYGAAAAPADPMRYDIELDRLESLAWGATGRSLLAWLSDAEVSAVIARGDRAPGTGQRIVASELRSALQAIREQGHALTRAHRTANTYGIAAPFFGADGSVIGNVALLIPAFRFRPEDVPTLADALRGAAAAMSERLGHGGSRVTRPGAGRTGS